MYYHERYDLIEIQKKNMNNTLYSVPNDVPYGAVIRCQKNGRKRVLEIINDCKEAKCRGDKIPYFILMKDKDIHANDILFEDVMNNYIERVVSADVTSDWNRLEFFLSKHLTLE